MREQTTILYPQPIRARFVRAPFTPLIQALAPMPFWNKLP